MTQSTPLNLEKIWGGSLFGENVGERWLISTLENHSTFDSKKIKLNYLVKLIETSSNLSVQVHPNDNYAKKNENSSGKDECWLILGAEAGSGIYLGLKEGISKESFKEAVTQSEDLTGYLNFYDVSPGDFFFVPAGSIHAIGKGVLLAEVQQSSGITYRIWDWNRLDDNGESRELHLDRAMDVIDFSHEFNEKLKSFMKSNLLSKKENIDLMQDQSFFANLYNDFQKPISFKKEESFIVLTDGLELSGKKLEKYSAFFIENGCQLQFNTSSENCTIICCGE